MPTQKYLIFLRSVPGKQEAPSPAQMQEIVGGYMVVAAENYEGAIEVARECPGVIRPGSSVEIREIARS